MVGAMSVFVFDIERAASLLIIASNYDASLPTVTPHYVTIYRRYYVKCKTIIVYLYASLCMISKFIALFFGEIKIIVKEKVSSECFRIHL